MNCTLLFITDIINIINISVTGHGFHLLKKQLMSG